ncbi:hypothetical protein F2981_21285 (plasmid) [Sinorhizobium meliloti]|nr:hypothetical protein [Sinorhizobium meliloti]
MGLFRRAASITLLPAHTRHIHDNGDVAVLDQHPGEEFAFTVILGTNGIVNSAIAAVAGDSYKVPMLFNRVGVYIGLAHWLLPFAVFSDPERAQGTGPEPSCRC